MKLLMFHAQNFWYKPHTIEPIDTEKTSFDNSIVVFIHVEESDKENTGVIEKAIGNIRWLSNKNKSNTVVLHSFAHLSGSKSDPETANNIIQAISEKLKKSLDVHIVPFGQLYEFSIHVFGQSLAKVFKDI